MSHTTETTRAADLQASTEALAMKMYRLTEIVRLAAYASGSGMDTKEADTSEVLYYVADELAGVSRHVNEAFCGLAAEATKRGGAQ